MESRGGPVSVWWSFLLAGALLGLTLRGAAVLPAPTVPLEVGYDPLLAALGLLRVAVAVGAGYLAMITGLVLLGRISGAVTLLRWARQLSIPVLRRALAPVLGAALVLGAAPTMVRVPAAVAAEQPEASATPTAGTPEPGDHQPPVMRWLGPGTGTDPGEGAATGPAPDDVSATAPGGSPELDRPPAGAAEVWSVLPVTPAGRDVDAPEVVRSGQPDAPTESGDVPSTDGDDQPISVAEPPAARGSGSQEPAPTAPGVTATLPRASGTDPTSEHHLVVAGESFWSIAHDRLEAELGRPPQDAEVVPVWRRLIEANEDQLVVPGEPDLIFPGQQLVLP